MKNIRFAFLFVLLGFFVYQAPVIAQQNGQGEEINWDDEEDEGGTPAVPAEGEVKRPPRDKATIYVDGKEFELSQEVHIKKGDTLDIQIRDVMKLSPLSVQIKKGGVVLTKKSFYSNERGEIDLEVQTGDKKLTGDAVVTYTSSSGKKNTVECKVMIE